METVADRVSRAFERFNSLDDSGAESVCLDILREHGTDVNALHILGRVYERTGRPSLAIETIRKALSVHNATHELHNYLGELLFDRGLYDEAADAFGTAVRLKPDYCPAHHNLGRIRGAASTDIRHVDLGVALRGRVAPRERDPVVFSCFQEQEIIRSIAAQLPAIAEFCIDIGAGDGMGFSNSYSLFRRGWKGIAIEGDIRKYIALTHAIEDFARNVNTVRSYVTPRNVGALLAALGAPAEPGFLTLDIDSYDYDVLAAVLDAVRPTFVCVEINERVHPEVDCALRYREGRNSPAAGTLHGGASVSMMGKLLDARGYGIVWLEYANLFAVQRHLIPLLDGYREMSAQEAWRVGFLERPDRRTRMPWNERYRAWFDGGAEECRRAVRSALAPYGDDFTIN